MTQARLDAIIERVLATVPPGEDEMREQIRTRLQHEFDSPPTEALEQTLRKRCTHDEARAMLFWPTPEQMESAYPVLIQPAPSGAPREHPQRRVQVPFLALLYMAHVKEWRLCAPFILGGGLEALHTLFLDENLYLRGQAIDAFMQCTNPPDDGYDWFADPAPTGHQDRRLAQRLLGLARLPTWLPALTGNFDNAVPGGSYLALQLLAFWLSWVRKFWTADGRLRLGAELRGHLERWAQRTDVGDEEASLAKRVWEDFSRLSASSLADGGLEGLVDESGDGSGDSEGAEEEEEKAEEAEEQPEKEQDDQQAGEIDDEPQAQPQASHREAGNAAFRAGDLEAAVAAYSRGIDEAPSAVLLSNRAVARIQLGQLEEAVDDCEAAIELDERMVKPRLNLAQALLDLGRTKQAWMAARTARRLFPRVTRAAELFDAVNRAHEKEAEERVRAELAQGLRAQSAKERGIFEALMRRRDAVAAAAGAAAGGDTAAPQAAFWDRMEAEAQSRMDAQALAKHNEEADDADVDVGPLVAPSPTPDEVAAPVAPVAPVAPGRQARRAKPKPTADDRENAVPAWQAAAEKEQKRKKKKAKAKATMMGAVGGLGARPANAGGRAFLKKLGRLSGAALAEHVDAAAAAGELPALVGEGLTEAVLRTLLEAARASGQPEAVVGAAQQVKRFGSTAMFLTEAEREELRGWGASV